HPPVPPREPSAATAPPTPGTAPRTDSPVRAIAASSSRAATRTATSSSTPRDGVERREHSVGGARLDAVVACLGAAHEQGEREAADRLVDVVDARDAVSLEGRHGGLARVRRLAPDPRDR